MGNSVCFIDGFNLFHALDKSEVLGNGKIYRKYNQYKWLNYWKLAECFVGSNDLERVEYFTALPHREWDGADKKRKRHENFIRVQEFYGVNIKYGRFRPVTRKCHARCKLEYKAYEEKRTDVHIGVSIVKAAVMYNPDLILIISGDSDLIPAIKVARELNSNVHVRVVVPISQRGKALSHEADSAPHMKISHLKKSVLPEIVSISEDFQVNRPKNWKEEKRPE